ncbi:TadE/TadG family type IV pilus assembly protein [Vibrio ostreicida]|uniref:Pilus assembly protein n=1 Tax=Vibrio ostreicida TaxID=526588 RepID=A0ABT8BYW7_9VIBR|nr:TadE family protein [Vibrio ostreicida]MDN3612286.1 pilus assembly protein [Vibrio ostreicida]NPD08669.1 pilus assembly protein [Vibrio ostreicida]
MVVKKQSGSQTVEFALVLVPLMILLLATFEFTRLMWVKIIFDSAVEAAVREVRVLPPSPMVDRRIQDRIAAFPLLKFSQIKVGEPRYADSIQSLANNKSIGSSGAIISHYQIVYQFSFVLIPRLSEQFSEHLTLTRQVLVTYDYDA